MRCPNCTSLDTQVKDSRPTEDSSVIRRRRVCLACNFRFTTFERVQLRELVVIKRNGRRVPFDRDKLARSVEIALRKRNVDPERVEQTISKIVRDLESLGENEVTTETIGETVMAQLRELDRAAQAQRRSRAGRADHLEDRARPGKPGRERGDDRDHRRDRDGATARARSRCASATSIPSGSSRPSRRSCATWKAWARTR